MKPKAIIVDLDGTLSDSSHRQHYMKSKKKDWTAFYSGIPLDPPNPWCKLLIEKLKDTHAILLVTGRPSEAKIMSDTKDWLSQHAISWNELFLRKEGDFRPDYIVKKEIYESFIKDHYDIDFCIDDRKQVADMWRSVGLVCLHCDEGNF